MVSRCLEILRYMCCIKVRGARGRIDSNDSLLSMEETNILRSNSIEEVKQLNLDFSGFSGELRAAMIFAVAAFKN